MNLKPVADYLQAQGFGTLGQTIFLNHLPADATEAVLIRPRLIGARIDHDLPGYLKFEFQVIVRGKTYLPTQTKANQIAKKLKMAETTLGVWHVNYLRPAHVPVGYPISMGELVEFNTDIEACIVDPEWEE